MVERYYERFGQKAFDQQDNSRLAERLVEKKQSERSLLDEAMFLSKGIHQTGPYKISREYEESVSQEMDKEAEYIFDEIAGTYNSNQP